MVSRDDARTAPRGCGLSSWVMGKKGREKDQLIAKPGSRSAREFLNPYWFQESAIYLVPTQALLHYRWASRCEPARSPTGRGSWSRATKSGRSWLCQVKWKVNLESLITRSRGWGARQALSWPWLGEKQDKKKIVSSNCVNRWDPSMFTSLSRLAPRSSLRPWYLISGAQHAARILDSWIRHPFSKSLFSF